MSWTEALLRWIGDFLEWTISIYDHLGNSINYAIIAIILFGMIYWLRVQAKLIHKDHIDPLP